MISKQEFVLIFDVFVCIGFSGEKYGISTTEKSRNESKSEKIKTQESDRDICNRISCHIISVEQRFSADLDDEYNLISFIVCVVMDCVVQFFTKCGKPDINMSSEHENNKNVQKTVGYLEKRGKLKLISSWKKYWFVLEGQLLLYYGSKDEYDSLSPCKGSILLGPTCNVKPYTSAPIGFQIETRSTTVTLRADSINDQTKWMQAILSSLNHNQGVEQSPTKLNHFRYSTERVNMLLNKTDSPKDANTPKSTDSKKIERPESALLDRLQKLGAKSYNDQSLESITTKKLKSPKKSKSPKFDAKTVEDVVIKDDDFCACEFTRKKEEEKPEELNNNWKLQTKMAENPRKLARQISLLSEYYSDNELYATPIIKEEYEKFTDNDLYSEPIKSLADRVEELQCSMEFVEEPNEFECENEVYCVPGQKTGYECENEIYCAPGEKNEFECENELYCVPGEKNEAFECANELYGTGLSNKKDSRDRDSHFECLNELYGKIREENSETNLYSEPTNEVSGSTTIIDENVYSVPFEQRRDVNYYRDSEILENREKTKPKTKKRVKIEEGKKTDGFIQRLFRQARKSESKSDDLNPDETEDVDKTLAMLTNLQDMLEKKKEIIKAMAEEKKSTLRRSGEEKFDRDNPKSRGFKSPDLLSDLNLEDEYSEVFDGLQDEDIYCEVTDGRPKEFRDLTGMLDESSSSNFKD